MITKREVSTGAENELSIIDHLKGYSLLSLAVVKLAVINLFPGQSQNIYESRHSKPSRRLVYVIDGEIESSHSPLRLSNGGVIIYDSSSPLTVSTLSGAKIFMATYSGTGLENAEFVGNIGEFRNSKGYMVGGFMKDDNLRTPEVEIAVMDLPTVDPSPPHYHQHMSEITYATAGSLNLLVGGSDPLSVNLTAGNFILVKQGVVLQNPSNEVGTKIVVVKAPSAPGDKYYYHG